MQEKRSILTSGTVLAGRYEIVNLIAKGEVVSMYKALDRQMNGALVAIKFFSEDVCGDPECFSMLKKQSLEIKKLRHDNIRKVFSVEQENGQAFMVLEFIDGMPLSKTVREKGELKASTALRIGIETCLALKQAHEHEIFHGNLKPSNIIVTPLGEVKICDFGFSPELKSAVSRISGKSVASNPLYKPPEQLAKNTLNARVDVYSLCMTLYECLLGEHPWAGEDDVFDLIRDKKPNAIVGIPQTLMQILLAGLEKNPALRPGTIEKLHALFMSSLENAKSNPDSFSGEFLTEEEAFEPPEVSKEGSIGNVNNLFQDPTSSWAPSELDLGRRGAKRMDSVLRGQEPPPPTTTAYMGRFQNFGEEEQKAGGGVSRLLFWLLILSAVLAGGYYLMEYYGKNVDVFQTCCECKCDQCGGATQDSNLSSLNIPSRDGAPIDCVATCKGSCEDIGCKTPTYIGVCDDRIYAE